MQTEDFGIVGDGVWVGGEGGDGGGVRTYADSVEGEDAVEFDLRELRYEMGVGGGDGGGAAARVAGVVTFDPFGEGREGRWGGRAEGGVGGGCAGVTEFGWVFVSGEGGKVGGMEPTGWAGGERSSRCCLCRGGEESGG